MKALIFLTLFSAVLVSMLTFNSCSSSSQNFTYEFSCNECETGKHEFDEKDAYCKALDDEDLNKGCCRDTRKERKKNDC